jgi:hypothetical protein
VNYANTSVNLAQVARRVICGDGENCVHGGAEIVVNESRVYTIALSATCGASAHA